jgi:hypothetical protein
MNRISMHSSSFPDGLAFALAASITLSSLFAQAQTTPQASPTPPTDKRLAAEVEHPNGPYRAFGRVTDPHGQPFPGVDVSAYCGAGTLKRSATAISDKDGRYELNFGHFWNKTVFAAVISAHKSGYVEANLNRHGSCLSAPNEREMLHMKGWKDRMDRVFLPGRSLELNFVMVPAARVAGKLIEAQNKPLAGYWVSLAFADHPTGSVMGTAKTDGQGRFALEDISTSHRFQFTVRKGDTNPPWDDSWASTPLRFERPETGDLRARFGTHEIRLQELQLRVTGPGVHLKTATAATHGTLNLTAPNPSDIRERSETRLVAKSAVLTLQNSLRSDQSQSLITESLPIEATRQ